MTEQKYISVSSNTMTIIALFVFAFVAGFFTFGAFLAPEPPPPVNLQAEYCRGIADGDMGNYINIQKNIRGLEADVAQNGLVLLLAIANPESGQVMQSVPLINFFPDREEGYFQVIEDACLKITTAEQFAEYNARGPSDLATTTTTLMGGAPLPEVDE